MLYHLRGNGDGFGKRYVVHGRSYDVTRAETAVKTTDRSISISAPIKLCRVRGLGGVHVVRSGGGGQPV